jgi:dTDP-glucose 4,6-dehydratase
VNNSSLVVISGVAGMTGSETARQFLKRGNVVIGFDNFFSSSIESIRDLLSHQNFRFYEFDLCNTAHMRALNEEVRDLAQSTKELSFVNCAAVVHTKYFYSPSATFDVNVIGMRSFLEQAIVLGAEKFINCSTSEVYSMKSFTEKGVKESDLLGLTTAETSQRSSYAAGKLLTEFFMKEAVEQGKILGCSLRFANVYSSEEELPEHIIPYVIDSLLRNGEVTLLENARVTFRTFLHNYDSCAAVIALLFRDKALDGSVYNVGTDEEIAITELVRIIGSKINMPNPSVKFEGVRTSDPPRRKLNTDKLKNATDWQPRVSLDQGLDDCIKNRKQRMNNDV